MHDIAVVGDKDSIQGFLALGLDVFEAYSGDEAESVIKKLAAEGYSIIYITEEAANDIMSIIDSYSTEKTPAIILIPNNKGTLGIGMSGVKKSVERAVGADILFSGE
jgi:V/A-type H+-transporting ATPase subunit F